MKAKSPTRKNAPIPINHVKEANPVSLRHDIQPLRRTARCRSQAQALRDIRGFHAPDSLLRRYSASAWAQAQAELHAHWKL